MKHIQFEDIYRNKKVLVTGHTGFKGSWLCLWLEQLGAQVCGYSLEAPTVPNQFDLLNLKMKSIIGDIRNKDLLNKAVSEFRPEIVFHLAAQPLVRQSYSDPVETYETNVIGSLNLYEACRITNSVKSIISITTDKVYENFETNLGYKENDRLGGKDPYSSSKAAMEIMSQSYVHSFFNIDNFEDHNVLLSTVRAGNVIGGGDWAKDRLIPDIIRASQKNEIVDIRSPNSVRPWQHVLDPLSGYLLLGQKLIQRKIQYAKAYNFGPPMQDVLTVKQVVEQAKKYWSNIKYEVHKPKEELHEANLLMLDCSLAKSELNWSGVLNAQESLKYTVEWYREYYKDKSPKSQDNLNTYLQLAIKREACWLSEK